MILNLVYKWFSTLDSTNCCFQQITLCYLVNLSAILRQDPGGTIRQFMKFFLLLDIPQLPVRGIILEWKHLGTAATQPQNWRPHKVTEKWRWVLRCVVCKSCHGSDDSIIAQYSTNSVHREVHGMVSMGRGPPVDVMCRWLSTFVHIVYVNLNISFIKIWYVVLIFWAVYFRQQSTCFSFRNAV